MGFPIIRKSDLEKGLDVIRKEPINTTLRKNIKARAGDVFFNVIIFLFWVDIILFLILAIGIVLHYIG